MRPRPKTASQEDVSVTLSLCHITFLSGYICSDTYMTPSHVTEINYVDRGVAARTPLQLHVVLCVCLVVKW